MALQDIRNIRNISLSNNENIIPRRTKLNMLDIQLIASYSVQLPNRGHNGTVNVTTGRVKMKRLARYPIRVLGSFLSLRHHPEPLLHEVEVTSLPLPSLPPLLYAMYSVTAGWTGIGHQESGYGSSKRSGMYFNHLLCQQPVQRLVKAEYFLGTSNNREIKGKSAFIVNQFACKKPSLSLVSV